MQLGYNSRVDEGKSEKIPKSGSLPTEVIYGPGFPIIGENGRTEPEKPNRNVVPIEESNRKWQEYYNKFVKPYKDIGLDEYYYHGSDIRDDSRTQHPEAAWKFHLNVAPENVRQVSEFLKRHNFHHKYLSGGEIQDGKIFTVYTGSKKSTEMSVRMITDLIGELLDEPKAPGEAAFSPKIVGRFEGNEKYFWRKRCRDGISIHRVRVVDPRAKITDEDVSYSRNILTQMYGDYFGGSINYYNPEKI